MGHENAVFCSSVKTNGSMIFAGTGLELYDTPNKVKASHSLLEARILDYNFLFVCIYMGASMNSVREGKGLYGRGCGSLGQLCVKLL